MLGAGGFLGIFVKRMRVRPRMSSIAVLRMLTRVSGSSRQRHGYLLDAVAALLGQDQELGVEEPLLVLDQRDELVRGLAADRLEAALGVDEAGCQKPP